MKDGRGLQVQKSVLSILHVMNDSQANGCDNQTAESTCADVQCMEVTSLPACYRGGEVERVTIS